ncbi:hypothetical protein GCM10017788_36720 [Amycolatopsis acidiphila]|nr:hypothetical protein GCM10017788_36720 [Amycolatopsis acidiphila]
MSRNRYTPAVRRLERARIARQEAALRHLDRELRGGPVSPHIWPGGNPVKEQRAARLESKQLHRLRIAERRSVS